MRGPLDPDGKQGGFYSPSTDVHERVAEKKAEAKDDKLAKLREAESDPKKAQDSFYSYQQKNANKGFLSRFKSNKKQLKKGLVASGLIGGLIAAVFAIMGALLPLKFEFLLSNINQNITQVANYAIEERAETIMARYITRRTLDFSNDGPTFQGRSLFDTLYGNWKAAKFENTLFEKYGYQIEAVDVNGNKISRTNRNTPTAWRVYKDGFQVASHGGSSFDFNKLGNDLSGREFRQFINKSLKDETRMFEVLKRRNLRKILRNKYNVPSWFVPKVIEDKTASYRQKKLDFKKWAVQRTVGPFSSRYAAFIACIVDGSASCGDILQQSDPDTTSPDGKDCAQVECTDSERARQDAGDELKSGSRNADTEGIFDNFDSNSDLPRDGNFSRWLAKFVNSELLAKIGKAASVVGIVLIVLEVIEKIDDGAVSEAMYSMRSLSSVSAATTDLVAISQLNAGELDAETAQFLFEKYNEFETHPTYTREFGGNTTQTASLFSSVFAEEPNGFDCDQNGVYEPEIDEIQSDGSCVGEDIYVNYEQFKDSAIFKTFAAIAEPFNAVLGPIKNVVMGAIDFVVGPIIQGFMEITGADRLAAAALNWVTEMILTPNCNGAEEGGKAYYCLRAGLEVMQSDIEKESVNGIGGKYLTPQEVAAIKYEKFQDHKDEIKNMSIASKYFSADNPSSLMAGLTLRSGFINTDLKSSLANLILKPAKNLAQMTSIFSRDVLAFQSLNYNPFGVIHYGYPVGSPDLYKDPESSEFSAENCPVDVIPSQTIDLDKDRLGKVNDVSFQVYTESYPCALERTTIEILSAMTTSEDDGGLGGSVEYYNPNLTDTESGEEDSELPPIDGELSEE